MAKLLKTTVFSSDTSPKETSLDKTTRIMRRITQDEAEVRHQKTARLRKALSAKCQIWPDRAV